MWRGVQRAVQPGFRAVRRSNNQLAMNNRRSTPYMAAFQRFFADKKVPLPSLGAESITEGEVTEWNVAVGDSVAAGDVLCSIETDKVTVEVEAPFAGVIKAFHAEAGDSVEVGNDLLTIDEGASGGGGGGAAPEKAAPAAAAAASGATIEVPLKDLGAESITEGAVQEWLKKVGESVSEGEAFVSIETDKVTIDIESPVNGVIAATNFAEGDTVEIGAILATITEGGSGGAAAAAAPAASKPAAAPAAGGDAPPSMLREGFKAAAEARSAPAAAPSPAATNVAPAAAAPKLGTRGESRVKMTRMRQAIARRLKDAQNTNAMLTTFNEVDMTACMEMRESYKKRYLDEHGVKFGFNSIFARAATMALQEIPAVNASIDDATNEIVFHDFVYIGVAVASPRGLVVPVIRNIETMNFVDIEKEIARLAGLARQDKIGMDDMSGGTFTISNGGVFGSMMGTPIINPPQSAILGMHAIKDRAMVVDGEVRVRPVMYLALTYDHRIIDGREAVTFLVSMKNKLEQPWRFFE